LLGACQTVQSDGGAGGRSSTTPVEPKTIAHQGWWRGWFEDTLNDHFEFRVSGDDIYDSDFSASRPNSICTVMKLGYGTQHDGAITSDSFDYSLGGVRFMGSFVDGTHSQVKFPGVDTSACDIQPSKSYGAYYVDDPCEPNVPQISGLSGGVTGGSSTIKLTCGSVLPGVCTKGVKEGALVHVSVDDLDGTGTSMEQADVPLTGGTTTAKVLFGTKPGKFQLVAQVEGVAPSIRTSSVTITQSTQKSDAGTGVPTIDSGIAAQPTECDAGVPPNGAFGLTVGEVTGFESVDDCTVSSGIEHISNANTAVSVELVTTDTIAGGRTLRMSFNYGNETTPWLQWSYFRLPLLNAPRNLTAMVGMRFKARANQARSVRLDLVEAPTSSTQGSVGYGWDLTVTSDTQSFDLRFSNAKIPAWTSATATVSLSDVLANLMSVIFMPLCKGVDSTGQLPAGTTDSGWVELDDVEFY